MKKIALATAVLLGSALLFSACSKKLATSDTDVQKLEQDASQITTETQQNPIDVDTVAPSSPLPTATDLNSLDKDLGNMKLDAETFQ